MDNTEKITQLLEEIKEILILPDEIFNATYNIILAELNNSIKAVNKNDMSEIIAAFQDSNNYMEAKQETYQGAELLINAFNVLEEFATSDEKKDFLQSFKEAILTGIDNSIQIYENDNPIFQIQLLKPTAKVPTYAHSTDAGCDLYAPEDIVIPAKSLCNKIPLGIAVAIKPDWQLAIRPRSGLSAKTGLRLSNCVGTIDSGYRDEICLLFDNISNDKITIHAGDRLAQFIPEKVYHVTFEVVDDMKKIGEDRNGGFGSTGV